MPQKFRCNSYLEKYFNDARVKLGKHPKLNALVDFFIEEESRYKEEIIKNKINGTRFNF